MGVRIIPHGEVANLGENNNSLKNLNIIMSHYLVEVQLSYMLSFYYFCLLISCYQVILVNKDLYNNAAQYVTNTDNTMLYERGGRGECCNFLQDVDVNFSGQCNCRDNRHHVL